MFGLALLSFERPERCCAGLADTLASEVGLARTTAAAIVERPARAKRVRRR